MSTSGTSAEENSARLRWLLRLVADDSLLEFCLTDKPAPLTRKELEVRFHALVADTQHPEAIRPGAWRMVLKHVLQRDAQDDAQVEWLALCERVREVVCGQAGDQRDEIARQWASPEFLQCDPKSAERIAGEDRYYELHLHFRGGVPFSYIWEQLMTHERARSAFRGRKHEVNLPMRTIVRAELVARASALHRLAWRAPIQEMQYQVLRLNLRRYLLHQRGQTGLVTFSASYDRYAKVIKQTGGRECDRAAAKALFERFHQSGAEAVELRPTLERTRIETQQKLRPLVLGYFDYCRQTEAPLAMGLVPSLFRQELVVPAHASRHGHVDDTELQTRLDHQREVWRRQVEGLLAIIDECPVLRLFIVGLDVAGIEHGAPVRDLAEAFGCVRRYHQKWGLSRRVAGRSLRRAGFDPKQFARADPASCCRAWDSLNDDPERKISRCRLGLTVHVGEDFIDPVTGLREIWEVIEHLGLEAGDRIGHGIAASLDRNRLEQLLAVRADDPKSAAVVKGKRDGGSWRLRKPLGLHALDLAWMQERLGTHQHERSAALALALGRALGSAPLHRATVHSLRTGPVSLCTLPGVHFVDPDALEPEQHCWMTLDEQWFAEFECLRRQVLGRLVRTGIVVESCPTSNQAVANLPEPPLFGLLAEDELRCVVATDDPGVLDAWPEHELARLDEQQRTRVLRTAARASFIRP